MKVLVCCQGGNVRSVTFGFILKYKYNIDAIAASLEKNSNDTLDMLFEWADTIIVVQESMKDFIPKLYHKKLLVLDIGPDRWGQSLHPELLQICIDLLSKALK